MPPASFFVTFEFTSVRWLPEITVIPAPPRFAWFSLMRQSVKLAVDWPVRQGPHSTSAVARGEISARHTQAFSQTHQRATTSYPVCAT